MKILQKICWLLGLLALACSAEAQTTETVYRIKNSSGNYLQLPRAAAQCSNLGKLVTCHSWEAFMGPPILDNSSYADQWVLEVVGEEPKEVRFRSRIQVNSRGTVNLPYYYLTNNGSIRAEASSYHIRAIAEPWTRDQVSGDNKAPGARWLVQEGVTPEHIPYVQFGTHWKFNSKLGLLWGYEAGGGADAVEPSHFGPYEDVRSRWQLIPVNLIPVKY